LPSRRSDEERITPQQQYIIKTHDSDTTLLTLEGTGGSPWQAPSLIGDNRQFLLEIKPPEESFHPLCHIIYRAVHVDGIIPQVLLLLHLHAHVNQHHPSPPKPKPNTRENFKCPGEERDFLLLILTTNKAYTTTTSSTTITLPPPLFYYLNMPDGLVHVLMVLP